MKITIIHGANLNLLGTREPNIYGNERLEQLNQYILESFPSIEFDFFQSISDLYLLLSLKKTNAIY